MADQHNERIQDFLTQFAEPREPPKPPSRDDIERLAATDATIHAYLSHHRHYPTELTYEQALIGIIVEQHRCLEIYRQNAEEQLRRAPFPFIRGNV